ncbi:hypothetical protein BGZ49_002509 [Haplosporangium sp. Z 27]|nr:hypothetical protein BGZ49_002509 [Haplosporangium sp. Z 27]
MARDLHSHFTSYILAATTDPSSSQSLTTVDSTGTTVDPTTAVSTTIESTATTIAVTATTTAATTAIDTTTIEPTTAITATDTATVSTITVTPSASIQTSPSPQQTSSSPQQTSNPGKTTTKQPPTTSFASGGDGHTKVPVTTTSPSADGSISKPPGSESSSSSNKTAITIGVVIGAVVVAAGIGVWVFRKAKLSPSREFKSKMRNSDLGSSGVLPGSVDTRGDPDNYEDIFRPPNHDTERPMTATSMGTTGLAGVAIGASGLAAARPSTSVSGSSPDTQNADYYYQNYPQGQYDQQQPGYDQYQQGQYDQYPQSYDQQQQHGYDQQQHGYDQYQQGYDQYQQPLPPQQHTVPDYAQYRYAQGGPATVGGANGSSGVYESGAHDGVLGGNNNNLSNDYARFLRELRE